MNRSMVGNFGQGINGPQLDELMSVAHKCRRGFL